MSRLYEPDVRAYLADFDFCLLVETFSKTFPSLLFPLHDVFIVPGVKLTDAVTARLSGGVVLLIRKELGKYVEQVTVEYDNIIVIKLSKDLFGTNTPIVLLGVYLPPTSSSYYRETEIHNGIALIEQCVMDIVEDLGDVPFILFGDFNARTGNKNPENEQVAFNIFEDEDDDSVQVNKRASKDKEVNDFGRYLLNVCEQFGFQIINGTTCGDECGNFTYVSSVGCSVIDYFIVSRCLLPFLTMSLKVAQKIESKHMPVELTVETQSDRAVYERKRTKTFKFEKYVWNQENNLEFLSRLSSDEVKDCFREATELIDSDINKSLLKFNEGLLTAGQCMKKSIIIGKEKKQIWFDLECRESRQVLRQQLRKYHKNNVDTDRLSYTQKRKEYKELLRVKKTAHRQKVLDALHKAKNDPKTFWGKLKSFVSKKHATNTISKEEWFRHFSEVFSANESTSDNYVLGANDEQVHDFDETEELEQNKTNNDMEADGDGQTDIESLDRDISEAEVYEAIRMLKNGKAAGPDRMISEFLKNSACSVVPFLVRYLNKLFSSGSYPDNWSEAVIQPLHKKGDPNIPDNYRGISLLNICGKLYSYIINKRLTQWIEENSIISESQAGFRKRYSTADHLFTLVALIQKQLCNHRKLYVAFIDFRKAFDSVVRTKLWNILRKRGVKGKMYQAIVCMYKVVKGKVRSGSDLTDSFMCPAA